MKGAGLQTKHTVNDMYFFGQRSTAHYNEMLVYVFLSSMQTHIYTILRAQLKIGDEIDH
jgi:hypothetical protein